MSIWFLIVQFQIEKFNYFLRQEFTLMCLQTRWALSRSIQIQRALCWQSFSQIFFCHILIQTKFKIDFFQPIHVSKILAKLAEQEKADMIMLGKVRIGLILGNSQYISVGNWRWQQPDRTNDSFPSQLASGIKASWWYCLSYFFHQSQGVFASKVTKTDAGLEVLREIDGGLETIKISLPAVLSADLR